MKHQKKSDKKRDKRETLAQLRARLGIGPPVKITRGSSGKGRGRVKDEPGVTRPFRLQTNINPGRARVHTSNMRHQVAVHYKGSRFGRTWGQRPGRLISTDGAKIKSVVKTRWVNKRTMESQHLGRHLNYLQNREKGPIEKGKEREFFSSNDSGLSKRDVEEQIKAAFGRQIAFHTMIVSPGDNSLPLMDYVREIMAEWENTLGKLMNWYAIVHENTDHYHAHLVIGGRQFGGTEDLKFTPEHLAGLRFISDEYIARDRELDKEFDRSIDQQNGFMMRRFENIEKLMELGLDWFRDWYDQVDLGLKTPGQDAQIAREFGFDRSYELGRPFDGVRVMTAEEIEELKRTKDESGEPKGEEDRDRGETASGEQIMQREAVIEVSAMSSVSFRSPRSEDW